MSELRDITKVIQGIVGEDRDGIFGIDTATSVLAVLQGGSKFTIPADQRDPFEGVDARSRATIETLDPKAQPKFIQFYKLANATAATLGCSYVFISGNRTWEEQDALYAQGRTTEGPKVTNARGGESNHNFGLAADAGAFRGKIYLDGGTKEQQALADKIHKMCSEHAAACGLEWGGSWHSIKDLPHYEVTTGLSLAAKRKLYQKKGSVL